jgi:hypothetical protein
MDRLKDNHNTMKTLWRGVNQEENVKVHQTGHSEVSEGDLGLKEDFTCFLTHRRVKLVSGA